MTAQFDFRRFVQPHIQKLEPYTPGLQLNQPDLIKLNTNENPFPPLPEVVAAIQKESARLHLYPDPSATPVRQALAEKYGREPDAFLIGNGSDEILNLLFRLFLGPGDICTGSDPAYSLYPVLCGIAAASIVKIPVKANWHLDLAAMLRHAQSARSRFIIVTHPNAPTGIAESRLDLMEFIRQAQCPVILDEAYIDFVQGPDTGSFAREAGTTFPHLIVLQTFSKSASLAGMRTGWCVGHPDLIAEMHKIRDSYNVSRISQAAALALLGQSAANEERIAAICKTRADFSHGLQMLGFEVLDSGANFVFTKPPAPLTAALLYRSLLDHGILVRHFHSGRLADYLRISIGSAEQMEKSLLTLKQLLL